jgi:hypothetical protein
MAKRSDITPELVRQLVRYEPETERWNTRYAGKQAFTAINHTGHMVGSIVGISFSAHHVAWAICTGAWPCHQIDHINGVPGDNRIENLRDVPQSENTKNLALRSDNISGVPGVGWQASKSRWRARVSDRHLGYFKTKAEAVAARRKHATAEGYILRVGHEPDD